MGFHIFILAATVLIGVSRDAAADWTGRCKWGCSVPPRCEALAKIAEQKYFGSADGFELWSVETDGGMVSQPTVFELENYVLTGTPGGDHDVWFSHRLPGPGNPRGDCRLVTVDGKLPWLK